MRAYRFDHVCACLPVNYKRMLRRSRRDQNGISLVELMVGVTVGLFVVAAAAMVAGTQLGSNRRLLLETQVHQDLRSSADIIARELRRAGYFEGAEAGIWDGVTAAPNSLAAILTPSPTEVGFRYHRGPTQEGPYGFRLDATAHSIRTNLGSGGASNWQELTDPRTLRVTELTITPVDVPEVILPCPKLCADGTNTCWPRYGVREFVIYIAGESVSDPAVQRSLRTNVRLRNDLIRYNDPLNPTQICPP